MAKCTFCGEKIPFGKEKIYVLKDGKSHHFCSSKCEKNMLKLRRKPIATKWSSRYIKSK